MNESQKLQDLVGPQESLQMMSALKRGATRRDILAMLMAGGMQATLAGGLATTAMSVHMGERMAAVMAGDANANPWEGRKWPAIPGHFGPPWFLPAVGLYYTLKDRLA